MSKRECKFKAIGDRLRLIRENTGLDQKAFVALLNFKYSAYNQWELGVRRITPAAAIEVSIAFGVTLDFIYIGSRAALANTTSADLIPKPAVK